jgi:hypothetical protein
MPRPLIDDWPLVLAIWAMEAATKGDRRTVHRLAANRLVKQRGLSKGAARARVKTILSRRYLSRTGPPTGDVAIDFGFVLEAARTIFGEAAACRLQASRARDWCYRSSGTHDDRLNLCLLLWDLAAVLNPPEAITADCQNVDLPTS